MFRSNPDLQKMPTITPEQFTGRTTTWKSRIESAQNIKDCFLLPDADNGCLRRFRIDFNQYIDLVSRLGVRNWGVYFGIVHHPQENRDEFQLYIAGLNESYQRITPIYLANNPINSFPGLILSNNAPHGAFSFTLPNVLVDEWRGSWDHICDNFDVWPPTLFRFQQQAIYQDTGQSTLEGFIFSTNDLLGPMWFNNLAQSHSNYLHIDVSMVLQASVELLQNLEGEPIPPSATVGLMFALVESCDGAEGVLSYQYDISSPCPPTCGQIVLQ